MKWHSEDFGLDYLSEDVPRNPIEVSTPTMECPFHHPTPAALQSFRRPYLPTLAISFYLPSLSFSCCFTAVEYLKSQGANIVSIQIPELEESRIAHSVSIGSEISLAVENSHPDQVENLVRRHFFFSSN